MPRNVFRMTNLLVRKRRHWGVAAGLVLASFAMLQNLSAQESEEQQGPSAPNTLAPGAYTFQMVLRPGVDVTARVNRLPEKGDAENKKSKGNEAVDNGAPPTEEQSGMMIRRLIRSGMVCVREKTAESGKESVHYYTGRWCVFDDPRKGLNVRQTSIEGLFFPAGTYHFPELLWAEPKTRQTDPQVKEGVPPIQLYKDGSETLVVDAATGRPLRYNDGQMEWKYSYKEDSTPIDLPEKIATALQRVVAKPKK